MIEALIETKNTKNYEVSRELSLINTTSTRGGGLILTCLIYSYKFKFQVSKGKEEISFYSIPEFEEWKESVANPKSWKVKYYKGLGTSTPKEAKEYFADMERHRILFDYSGITDDEAISLVGFADISSVAHNNFSIVLAGVETFS